MEELLKQHLFATHAVAAAGSVALASSLTHPLDTLKSLLQVGAGSRQQMGLSQVLDRVRSVSGISGLYSGFGWLTLGRILGIGTRFGTYEVLTAFYKDGREDNYVYVSEALSAGLTAGAIEALISTPFELFKLREQVNSASYPRRICPGKVVEGATMISKLLPGHTPDGKAWSHTVGLLSALPKHSNTVGALKQYPWMLTGSGRPPLASEVKSPLSVISLEGWGAIWRGLRSAIARDSIFAAAAAAAAAPPPPTSADLRPQATLEPREKPRTTAQRQGLPDGKTSSKRTGQAAGRRTPASPPQRLAGLTASGAGRRNSGQHSCLTLHLRRSPPRHGAPPPPREPPEDVE